MQRMEVLFWLEKTGSLQGEVVIGQIRWFRRRFPRSGGAHQISVRSLRLEPREAR